MFNGGRVSVWGHTLNCIHQKVCKMLHLKFHVYVTTKYTILKSNHWKVRSSLAFGTFTMMCNHHLELVPNIFFSSQGASYLVRRHPHPPPPW